MCALAWLHGCSSMAAQAWSAMVDFRERPLMMSDFRGGWGSEMTTKNWTLEGKNRTLGGNGGSKIVKNRRTSFMDDPLH